MKRTIKSIVCLALIIVTMIATYGIAFAYSIPTYDPHPRATWSHFPTRKKTNSGHLVRGLQQILLITGYAPGTVDGSFGSNTEAAVKRYQAAYGLSADGIVGSQTWGKMRSTNVGLYEANWAPHPCAYTIGNPLSGIWGNSWPQDRLHHYADGSWWLEYGNTPGEWSARVKMID